MEAIVVIGLLVSLAVAALRWGADSRPRVDSREWHQARLGLTWGSQLPPGPHVRPERGAFAIARRARRAARLHAA